MDNQETRIYTKIVFILLFTAICSVYAISYFPKYFEIHQHGSIATVFVLLIPVFFYLLSLLFLIKSSKIKLFFTYLTISIFSVTAYFVAFNKYISSVSSVSAVSISSNHILICLCAVVFFLLLAGFWSFLIFNHNYRSPSYEKVNEPFFNEISEPDFSSIIFFLGYFFKIALLIAFLFAFDDIYHRNHETNYKCGLFSADLTCYRDKTNKQSMYSDDINRISADIIVKTYTFVFSDCKASFSVDEKIVIDGKIDNVSNQNNSQMFANSLSMNNLLNDIRSLVQNNPNDKIIIRIIGHTSTPLPTNNCEFKTNSELANARTDFVDLIISRFLDDKITINSTNGNNAAIKETSEDKTTDNSSKWKNIDFYQYVLASEEYFVSEQIQKDSSSKQCVEVTVTLQTKHYVNCLLENLETDSRRLELIDYMYFSFYTITTTGYGDIYPISSRAKALTILTNFSEVFFMIVFFNILFTKKQAHSDHIKKE